jgi:rubrerythrin
MPLVALFVLAKAGVRSAVARIRGDRTRCPSCGYARTGLSADARCPECGQPPAKTSRRP